MLNHITIMGRLVRDPELRRTGSGVAVASFRVAVDRDFVSKEGGERKADFIDPFVNYSDELLTEEHIDKLLNPDIIMTDKSRSSYGFSHSDPQYSYWQIKNLWRK